MGGVKGLRERKARVEKRRCSRLCNRDGSMPEASAWERGWWEAGLRIRKGLR